MKKISFTILLLSFIIIGCKPKRDPSKTYFDKPSEYNDFIVSHQREVMGSFDDFADAVNHSDKDSMSFFRKTLENRALLAEESVAKLADFKQDTLFRFAALELFRYVGYACDHELKDIVHLAAKDSAITDADVEQIRILSETYTVKEKEKNDALIVAQELFAKKFNVTIQ